MKKIVSLDEKDKDEIKILYSQNCGKKTTILKPTIFQNQDKELKNIVVVNATWSIYTKIQIKIEKNISCCKDRAPTKHISPTIWLKHINC